MSAEVLPTLGVSATVVSQGGVDGLEKLLQAVSMYRKKDPEGADEKECVENLFNCLSSALVCGVVGCVALPLAPYSCSVLLLVVVVVAVVVVMGAVR
jgi:hypothetical protein